MLDLQVFFGPYYEYFIFAVILLVFVVAAKAVNILLGRYVSKLAEKTKSELDDIVLQAVRRPLFIGIFFVGLYFALQNLTLLLPYMNEISVGFTIIYAVYGAWFVVRIINSVLEWYGKEIAAKTESHVDDHFLSIFKKVVYIIVFALMALWIMGQLGIEITTLIAAFGIGGLAIALALQDTLSNFFSGAHIALDRPIKIGDYIELDSGEKGYVDDIGWRSTKLRLLGNNLVVIPNSKLADSKLINYSSPSDELSVILTLGVAYDSDLDKVEKVTIDVAKQIQKKLEGAVSEHEPFIRYNEFGDSSINFSVILKAKTYVDRYLIIHEFIKTLKKRYDKEKIEIAFPQMDVHLKRK